MDLEQLLSQTFNLYFKKVYRFFYLKTFSKELAEDLTSDTFLKFTNKAKQFSLKNERFDNPHAYLFGIARNVFYNHLRRKYRFQKVDIAQLGDVAEQIVALESQVDLKKIASHFIQKLPAAQRTVLYLRLIEEKPLAEICERLEKDMNYVKTTQKRGIASLKKLLMCTPLPTTLVKD